jgi:hypothetical protein
MSKKNKKNRKRKQELNPNKLSEGELHQRISRFSGQQNTSEAYKLVKIVFKRFDTPNNRQLFSQIFYERIQSLLLNQQGLDIQSIINEVKKHFPEELTQKAEQYFQIRQLDGSELISHFSQQDEIPEDIRYELADHLYFSQRKEKDFLNKYAEYKDLFFVKEAFKNGYEPTHTPKMMSRIGSKSPFKFWVLLRKAIEAFLADDLNMLLLLLNKIPHQTFPHFFVEKLCRFQQMQNEKGDTRSEISDEDRAVFKLFIGEDFSEWLIFKKISAELKRKDIRRVFQLLKFSKKDSVNKKTEDLFCLFLAFISNNFTESNELKSLIENMVVTFPKMDLYYMNPPHLIFKLLNKKKIKSDQFIFFLEDALDEMDESEFPLFKQKELKAEILYYLAEHEAEEEKSFSIFNMLLNKGNQAPDPLYDKARQLEKSLKHSSHNPEIFIALIKTYRDLGEKTSKINAVINQLISNFPNNSQGYQLAGEIALKNRTFTKAIDFFSKAYTLMPLNVDLVRIIFDCYNRIITSRSKTNAHLIDKDLENAKKYASGQKWIAAQFELLRARALYCKFELNVATLAKNGSEGIQIFDNLKQSPFEMFDALFQFEQLKDNSFFKNQLITYKDILNQNINPKIFLKCLQLFTDKPPNLVHSDSFFYEILMGFITNFKNDLSFKAESLLPFLGTCTDLGWYKLLTTLVLIGNTISPEDGVFGYLSCLLNPDIKQENAKKYCSDEKTLKWLQTQYAADIVQDLFYEAHCISRHLDELYDTMFYDYEYVDAYDKKDFASNIKYRVHQKTISAFNRVQKSLLKKTSILDKTPIDRVFQVFGIGVIKKTKNKVIKSVKKKNRATKKIVKMPKQKAEPPGIQMDFFNMVDE